MGNALAIIVAHCAWGGWGPRFDMVSSPPSYKYLMNPEPFELTRVTEEGGIRALWKDNRGVGVLRNEFTPRLTGFWYAISLPRFTVLSCIVMNGVGRNKISSS